LLRQAGFTRHFPARWKYPLFAGILASQDDKGMTVLSGPEEGDLNSVGVFYADTDPLTEIHHPQPPITTGGWRRRLQLHHIREFLSHFKASFAIPGSRFDAIELAVWFF